MKKVALKNVKKGDYFILTDKVQTNENWEVPSKYVYVKGHYNRSDKDYTCHKFDDICAERFFKGSKQVYVDFIF